MDALARRCTATNRAGEQCGRAPIPGGSVCALHGGKAPQTVAAAKARLLAGADLAIDYLLSMLEPRALCPTCGRSDADRDPVVVRACQLVLDRSGFGPSSSLAVTPPPELDLSDLSMTEIADRAEGVAREFRRLADEEAARLLAPRTGATVIEGLIAERSPCDVAVGTDEDRDPNQDRSS